MSSLFRRDHAKFRQTPSVMVEIPKTVIDRITKAIRDSDVEEGGKLLGLIEYKESETCIRIDTYLDSGPGADKSASHIIPDSEYQEALYRVVESFDPEIEHIGSWHSHHCNGLKHLSEGDLENYYESVNDPRYNSHLFFVMLILGIQEGVIQARFFLFTKGKSDYIELDNVNVITVSRKYHLEQLLEDIENTSLLARRSYKKVAASSEAVQEPLPLEKQILRDPLQKIRAQDRIWFRANFPKARTVFNHQTKSLSWVHTERIKDYILKVRYEHPPLGSEELFAHLKIFKDNTLLISNRLEINESRFETLKREYREVLSSLLNS